MQTNLNKVYTAQDYILEFYNAEEASTQNIKKYHKIILEITSKLYTTILCQFIYTPNFKR